MRARARARIVRVRARARIVTLRRVPVAVAADAVADAADPDAAPADANAAAASLAAVVAFVVAMVACPKAISACAVAISACAVAICACACAVVFAASACVFAVSACVLNVCVSVFKSCNSALYVVETCKPNEDDDKLLSESFKSKSFVTESSFKQLPVFNPLQSNVVHNSLLAFICNVSLYLALNFLVEKSINNGASLSTPLQSNLGFKLCLDWFQTQNNQY